MKLIYAELKKIWFLRTSRIYLMFSMVASVLIGLTFSLTTKITQNRSLSELNSMEILSVNMLGVDVVTIFLIIFIAIQVGREFQEKTMQSYLMVAPTRSHYLLAKVMVFFLISFGIGIVVAAVTWMNGQILISKVHKAAPTWEIMGQFIVGCLVMPIFYSLLTVCATFLVNNSTFPA